MSRTGRQLVLVGVATVIGAAILAFGLDGDGSGSATPAPTPTPTIAADPAPGATPTPSAIRDPASVNILVANSVGVPGLAGTTTEALTAGLGFTALPAVDSTGAALDETAIYFVDGYGAEAEQARTILRLGAGATVTTMPAQPPVADLAGVHVLVIVGNDLVPA